MANITIRNLPDEVHHMLKLLAKRNERSTEAEARHILKTTVSAAAGSGLGHVLTNIFEADEFDVARSSEPLKGAEFE